MLRKIAMIAAIGFAASLFAGNALAGPHGGVPTPGHAKGHSKGYAKGHSRHQSYRHERGRGYYRDRREHSYGHRGRGYSYGYKGRGHGYHRSRGRVVEYSRYEVHRHGPGCGHRGYSRSSYRSYSPQHHYYDYRRDYGRASFRGRGDGVRYWVEFDY